MKKTSGEIKQIKEMKKTVAKIKSSYIPSKGDSSWLVIVESPFKCKKIEEYLGPEYRCIATLGHLQYIEGLNAIEIKDKTFHIQYSVLPDKKTHIQNMQRLISVYPSNRVLIATDDDREGEAIAWHILTLFHLPLDTPRIKFHEITRQAINEAVKNPTVVNQNLVQSQQARQVIDLLIGFKISPLLWKYVCQSKKDALSAGRCQTVALRLIYENFNREKSNTEDKWKTIGYFTNKMLPFTYSQNLNETNLLHIYRDIQTNPLFKFSICEKKQRVVQSPKPFTTARLLQNYTSISPSQVMSLCQILYHEGYITYMRTDSENYSEVFVKQAQDFLNRGSLEFGVDNPCCNPSKILGPHEAIRVTCLATTSYIAPLNNSNNDGFDKNTMVKSSSLNTLYQYIWKNTVQSCMPPAIFEDVEIIATPKRTYIETLNGVFKHAIEIPIKYGWTALGKTPEVLTQQATIQKTTHMFFQSIVSNEEGNDNSCLKLESSPLFEQSPKHYSEASLITQLEKRGIGRPSTYAYLIETIIERGYVKITDIKGTKTPCCNFSLEIEPKDCSKEPKMPKQEWHDIWIGKEQNRLVIQTIGIMTIEFLMTYFDSLFSYDYTCKMERELDKVAEGEITKQTVCLNCQSTITESTVPLRTVERKSIPKIDGLYEFQIQSFGNVLKTVLEDGTVEYYPVKNVKLDFVRLNTPGGYSANDLLEFPNKTDYLGKYMEKDVRIKKGPFGWYISYYEPVQEPEVEGATGCVSGNSTVSIPRNIDIHSIQLEDAISWIEEKNNPKVQDITTGGLDEERKPRKHPPKSTLLRTLDSTCSVRNGKYGPFVMLSQEQNAAKNKRGKNSVQFYNIQGFTGDYLSCSKTDLLQYIETLRS